MKWYQSRGIWAALVAVFAQFASVFLKLEISDVLQQQMIDVLMSFVTVVSGLYGVYEHRQTQKSCTAAHDELNAMKADTPPTEEPVQ